MGGTTKGKTADKKAERTVDGFLKKIDDIALIFEGGGMRASYTCAFVNVLLEKGIAFGNVYGVSAGASNTVNYVSRDADRARKSFVEFAGDPDFGGWGSFLRHKGFFNAHYIYQVSGLPGHRLEFDYASFAENPARVTISGLESDTGCTVYWTREDLATLEDLMVRVRASSTLPLVMPPPKVKGKDYYDGGLGDGSGILLQRAIEDGFERFVVVRTRPRSYRKKEGYNRLIDLLFWKRPKVQEALRTRAVRYNRELDRLEKLEEEGRAYVFYAEDQLVESGERDVALLTRNYELGYAQAIREFDTLLKFLG